MAVNSVSELQTPTLSVSNSTIKLECQWHNDYTGGAEEFVNMDCVWDLHQGGTYGQYASHHGQSEMSSDSLLLTRGFFFPCTSTKITGANVRVRGVYEGVGRWSVFAGSPTLWIKPPYDPEITITLEDKDGKRILTVKVESDEGSYDREWYDTDVTIEGLPNGQRTGSMYHKELYRPRTKSYTWSKDITQWENWVSLGNVDYYEVQVQALSRGIAGTSGLVRASRVLAHPNKPQITGVARTADTVKLAIRSNATRTHPTTSMEVQRLRDTEAETPEQAMLMDGWTTDVDTIPGGAAGWCEPLADARPLTRGCRTFYRLKASHDSHSTYSIPADLGLYTPPMTVTPSDAYIFSAISGDDGESVVTDIAWRDETISDVDPIKLKDYSFTTQITWGEAEYSWESTGGVSDFDFDWENPELLSEANANKPTTSTPDYTHAGRVYVTGLSEGEPVYLRAHRKWENGDEEGFGAWSQKVMVIPVSAPAWVTLQAPACVARGEDIPLSWTFGSEAAQTGWMISDASGIVLARGPDANGYAILDASAAEGLTELELRVSVTTGGNWKDSDLVKVAIADAPTCSVEVAETITKMPLSLTVASSASEVRVAIISRGIAYATPSGMVTQYAGDIVWSGSVVPGDVTVEDATLVNGCTYDVVATAKDADTGLISPEAADTFAVNLARRAPMPSATISVDAAKRSATVTPACPEATEGDVCDIYRKTPDGAQLIARDVAIGSAVTDRFAPYSTVGGTNPVYRVATRTKDGSVTWNDVSYVLKGEGIRLDWGQTYLELPYNVTISEQFDKNFEARTHLDGTTNGYWNRGAVRQSTMTSDLIKLESDEEKALLREMARSPQAVFVRTPSGLAFDANVELDEIEESYDSGVTGVSLKVTEVALTEEHRCSLTDIVAPAGEEGA